jgi:two-component system, chemotaxis family, response regulator Rcp1
MTILLVEDNPGDVRLTQEALKEGQVPHELIPVPDGEAALRYLLQNQGPRPDLIFLDLNLPRKGGREVLAELKQHAQTQMIPVIILTTSEAEQDISESYRLYANCYIAKPVDINQFIEVIKSVEKFWFQTATLPRPASE